MYLGPAGEAAGFGERDDVAPGGVLHHSIGINHLIYMKRYCQTLDLYEDPELIEAYVKEHRQVWDEIKEGIRSVGILDMQIYILANRLFMIVDTTDEFDWEKDNARLATLPRQAEWEARMSKFQVSRPGQASHQKWQLMEQIFGLND